MTHGDLPLEFLSQFPRSLGCDVPQLYPFVSGLDLVGTQGTWPFALGPSDCPACGSSGLGGMGRKTSSGGRQSRTHYTQ